MHNGPSIDQIINRGKKLHKDNPIDSSLVAYVISPRKPIISNIDFFKNVVTEGSHKMVNCNKSSQKTFSKAGKAVNAKLMSLDASSKNENAFFKEYFRPDTPE